MKVINIVGARPNFMKVAPLHQIFLQNKRFQSVIVHTGQHYGSQMSDIFFRQLELPYPDIYLEVGSGSHAQQTARIMMKFEEVMIEQKPDLVLVVGDVNSTLACSLVASKLNTPVAHVEAGLRSGDRLMPEEVNRVLTDQISDFLFVSEQSGLEHLKREGIDPSNIFFTGNVMIDSLVKFREKAAQTQILENLKIETKSFVLMTMHRPSNVDSPKILAELVHLIEQVSTLLPLVFPIHPRTLKQLENLNLKKRLQNNLNLILLEPLGYLEFLKLMENAMVVVTDSGGIQEETTFLQIPCLTLRENTERPVTVELGTNELLPLDTGKIINRIEQIMNCNIKQGKIPPLWDGKASQRIVDILVDRFSDYH